MQMRVLVTGGTGFIGGKLCARLAQKGYTVRALIRNHGRGSLLRQQGVETVLGDVRALASLERATLGIDTVYHCAALFRSENVTQKEVWDTNVQGLANLLEAAVRAGVRRFVHCSSTSVYGLFPKTPTTEDAPVVPIKGDWYQGSKIAGEKLLSGYMAQGRLSTVIFRTTGVYGPGDTRFLKLFKAIAKKRFIMLGPGTIKFPMTYIDDLLDGVVLCGTVQRACNNDYLLTGNKAETLNDTVRIIAEALDVPSPRLHFPVAPIYLTGLLMEIICKPLRLSPPLYRRRVNFFRMMRDFDISKARRELGFQPKVDLFRGAQLTMEWYHRKGLL
jgi:nucleoside-diphosphate-sugar epimerase